MTSTNQAPSCFIGSSAEGKPYAEALKKLLEDRGVACELWNLTTFALGQTSMESLDAALARNSFAALVATADDKTISRKKAKLSPRDNIVFEFGLFAGRLGRARSFLLVPDDVPGLKLPTDLLGVTVGTFTVRKTAKARVNGMRDAADKIATAVEREGALEAPSDPALANDLLLSVSTQLDQLRSLAKVTMNAAKRAEWEKAVLAAVLDPFLSRSEDAYSTWLRPSESNPDVLSVVRAINLDAAYEDHTWKRNEGMVGKVWETGRAKAVDTLKHDPWFKARPGCENETYLCVPVGKPGGPEGVLAVGSDDGFDVRAGDLGLLHAYGALLALAMPTRR